MSKSNISFFYLSLLMFFIVSCGGNGTISKSCIITEGFICQDYLSSFGSDPETACTEKDGTFSNTACTTTGRVGSCAFTIGDEAGTVFRYYSTSNEIASLTCTTLTGTYTSGLSSSTSQ